MKRLVAGGLLAAASSACARDQIALGLPDFGDAPAALLAVSAIDEMGNGEVQQLVALTASDSRQITLPQDGHRHLELTVAMMKKPLDALGLEPGALIPAAAPDPGRVLPDFSTAYSLVISPRPGSWTAISALPASLEAFRLPSLPSPCATFSTTPIALIDGTPSLGIAIHDALGPAALVGVDSTIFRIRPSGVVEQIALSPEFTPTGGIEDGRGGIYLGASSGTLWHGSLTASPALSLTQTATSNVLYPHWFDLSPPGDALELWVLGETGQVARYRGGPTLDRIFTFGDGITAAGRGGMVRIAPGVAASAFSLSASLEIFDGDATRSEVPATEGLTALARIEGLGVVGGNSRGLFYTLSGQHLVELEGTTYKLIAEAIVPYDDGFLAGGTSGYVVQYKQAGGYCPSTQLGGGTIRYMIPLGRDVLLVESRAVGTPAAATVLHRTE